MATLIDRIKALSDRLQVAPAPKPRNPAPVVEVAEPAKPGTITSLTDALDRLAQERNRQLAIINGAEDERDRILADESVDDTEVLAINNRVALARLAIDRLTRIEQKAVDQLAPLMLVAKQERWVQARDHYLADMRQVHAAMETFEIAANRLWSRRMGLFNPVGVADWEQRVPGLPTFAKGVVGGLVRYDSSSYRAEAERFATLVVGNSAASSLSFKNRLTRYIHGTLGLIQGFTLPRINTGTMTAGAALSVSCGVLQAASTVPAETK